MKYHRRAENIGTMVEEGVRLALSSFGLWVPLWATVKGYPGDKCKRCFKVKKAVAK